MYIQINDHLLRICREVQNEKEADVEAEFVTAKEEYKVVSSDPIYGSPRRKHAVRVLIQEDRVIPVKYQWFCDGTFEKTVSLAVRIFCNFMIFHRIPRNAGICLYQPYK